MEKKEKDPFYSSILTALNPSTSNNDVNKILYNFQHQVNAFVFTRYKIVDVPEIFRNIWKLLLTTAGNQSSTTRLASYRATGAFLTRVTPYYPAIIHESFSDVTMLVTIDVKSSAIIASSFAFISTYIAAPSLPKFLNSTPVFHHFSSNDPAFSEHLAVIISNLGHLGTEWLKNLLHFFLERIEESQSRYLIRAVSAIIGHDPKLYIQLILEWMENKSKNFINLFSFLIAGHQKEIVDIDLFPVAKSSALLIGEGKANFTDTDSAFQILSTHSNYFNVNVHDNNDGTINIAVHQTKPSNRHCPNTDTPNNNGDESNEVVEIKFEISKVLQRPSFYMMKLPMDYLRPKEDDSVLVLGAKFKSLAAYSEFNTTDVFNIYEPYFLQNYNETVSTVIQGTALCINRFLTEIPPERLAGPLRKVLFAKTVSWYHSFDILRVIKEVNPRLFISKLGRNFFVELLKCLIDFCFCENDSLSSQSITVLTNLTTKANFDIVIQTVVEKSEFFDPLLLRRAVLTVCSIIQKVFDNFRNFYDIQASFTPLKASKSEQNNSAISNVWSQSNLCGFLNVVNEDKNDTLLNSSMLKMFAENLVEAAPIYMENLTVISEILKFFSIYYYEKEKLNDIINAALCIAMASVEVISGQEVKYPFTVTDFQFYRAIVEQDIFNRNSDIITEANNDYKAIITPLRNALMCVFKYTSVDDGIFISNISHQLFPVECSRYYYQKWNSVSDSQRDKILKNIHNFLSFVSDERVHIEWCKICLKVEDVDIDERYKKVLDFLKDMAIYYLNNTVGTDPQIAAAYIRYLINIKYEGNMEIILKYLKNIQNISHYEEFMQKVIESYSDVLEIPELLEFFEPYKSILLTNPEVNQEPIESILDEIPENLTNEDIQILFESIIRHNDINLLQQVIRISEDRSVLLKTKGIIFSHEAIPFIVAYKAKHFNELSEEERNDFYDNPNLAKTERIETVSENESKNEVKNRYLFEAMRNVRTVWGPLYIETIKSNPNGLLDYLNHLEKVKKSEILNLCSIIGKVDFDKMLLYNLTTKLSLTAKSIGRYRVTLLLFCVVISQMGTGTVPKDFLPKFIKFIDEDFERLPCESLCHLLLLFAQKVPLEYDTIVFIKKCFILCSNGSPSYGYLHQILIGMSTNLRLVGRNYLVQLPEVLFPCLKNKMPSRYCVGLRLFEQIALSIPPGPSSQILPKAIEKILDLYLSFSNLQPVMEQYYRSLMGFMLKTGIPQQHAILFHALPNSTMVEPNAATFNASCAFLPVVMRIITPNDENFRNIYSYCESLFNYPSAFPYAMRCLYEWVKRIDEDEQETLLMNSLLTWLKTNETCGRSYKEQKQVGEWISTYTKFMSPGKAISVLGFQLMKSVSFGSMYSNVLNLFIKNRCDEELNMFFDGIADIPQWECHRMALKLVKSCDKYQEMLQLSYFESDCEESQKLVEKLQEYVK
ncbi:hypothetical protein TRFO_27427 [Tritrichomonas foetus]|uniref:Uncharacterized protein n=1 Tax=Tritrichomonas foetus TaxID=1144522 RepID=A0A1J4K167_9EUKA|nr:hypothetical protein TRFO_27427 [Tritrichomonas foetus]|eukprot:OHT04979.1 hypothetical protein TRFO_27427 [Tritrichomonas foetus]